MAEAVQDPGTHRYPAYSGMNLFREAVARWYQERFGVELDPESEVLTLIGSKEGIAHLPLGINDPEDINLMTTPGYPVYQMGTLFAGGLLPFPPPDPGKRLFAGLGRRRSPDGPGRQGLLFQLPQQPHRGGGG